MKEMVDVQTTAVTLVNQILNLESTYDLTQSNVLTLLVDISVEYDCQVVLNSSRNDSVLMFFKENA